MTNCCNKNTNKLKQFTDKQLQQYIQSQIEYSECVLALDFSLSNTQQDSQKLINNHMPLTHELSYDKKDHPSPYQQMISLLYPTIKNFDCETILLVAYTYKIVFQKEVKNDLQVITEEYNKLQQEYLTNQELFQQQDSTSLAEVINISAKYSFEKQQITSTFILTDGQFSDITDSVQQLQQVSKYPIMFNMLTFNEYAQSINELKLLRNKKFDNFDAVYIDVFKNKQNIIQAESIEYTDNPVLQLYKSMLKMYKEIKQLGLLNKLKYDLFVKQRKIIIEQNN